MIQTVRIAFTVPLVPVSVNHYKVRYRNGRTVVSEEALAYKSAVAVYLAGRYVTGMRFAVTLRVVQGVGDKGDWDNYPKIVCDGLSAAGAFRNPKGKVLSDAHVKDGRVIVDCDERPAQGRTEIVIEAI